MIAGSAEAKQTVDPFLKGIGRATIDLGDKARLASVLKLTGNFMIVGIIELLAESMTFADTNGISRDQYLQLVNVFFPAPAITGYAGRMARDDFSTNGGKDGFSIMGGIKDASLVKSVADLVGSKVDIVEIALKRLKKQSDKNVKDQDWAALAEVVREVRMCCCNVTLVT